MRRTALLIGLLLLVSLALAPAAGAQGAQSSSAIVAGAPPPPAYVLERDGTVINGGDVVTDCQGLLISRAQGYVDQRREAQEQAVADKCRELGVPSGDLATGASEVVLSLGTEGPPAPVAGELPDTGGLSLTSLAGLASGIALIGGGLLLRRHKG